MTLFAGKCVGGPWDGQLMKTHSNYVRVPLRHGSVLMGPQKAPPRPLPGDTGLYQLTTGALGISTWAYKAITQ
jgi:hypothetical protein